MNTNSKSRTILLRLMALLLSMLPVEGYAQYENVWCFGDSAGLDFSNGSPIPITTSINTTEACASVCDATGHLLFYTEGTNVWDRNHNLMSNGTAIQPEGSFLQQDPATASTSQGAAIVPVPGSTTRYYIFSLTTRAGTVSTMGRGRLYYSIIDMGLNSGLGDVDANFKGVFIDSILTEKMTTVAGNRGNVWLLVHGRDGSNQGVINSIRAYEITCAGINLNPVISTIGPIPSISDEFVAYHVGSLIVSPDTKKLAETFLAGQIGFALYDFDTATGSVSNYLPFLSDQNYWLNCKAAAFSPNSSKLYIGRNGFSNDVMQFDISLASPALMLASATPIVGAAHYPSPKLAPDGKIYFYTHQTSGLIGCIQFPDLSGNACQPLSNAVQLLPGTRPGFDFPNVISVPKPRDTVRSTYNITACFSDSLIFGPGGGSHVWWNGSTSSYQVISVEGIYWVRYELNCIPHIDTFSVNINPFPILTTNGKSCTNAKDGIAYAHVDDDNSLVYKYEWMDFNGSVIQATQSDSGSSIMGLDTGKYQLNIISPNGCDTTLYFSILPLPAPTASFTSDSIICTYQDIHLLNTSTGDFSSWLWDFGDGTISSNFNAKHEFSESGLHKATLVMRNDQNCVDTFKRIIEVRQFTIELSPSSNNVNFNNEIILQTHSSEPYVVFTWRPVWIFFAQNNYTQTFKADSSRSYVVIGSNELGCIDSAEVFVSVNSGILIPSVFSPNGDGRNDYFRPLGTKSDPFKVRFFRVYDRWGKVVWGAYGSDAARGWDGTYSGTPGEVGTYFYTIEIELSTGKTVAQKGDVALIR